MTFAFSLAAPAPYPLLSCSPTTSTLFQLYRSLGTLVLSSSLPPSSYPIPAPRSCVSTANSASPQAPPSSPAVPLMERCLLVLCGKSHEEKSLAYSIEKRKALKFADRESSVEIETQLRLHHNDDSHESGVSGDAEAASFVFMRYMDLLRTHCFGRFLVWTPLITSTHDLLHQNFSELPVGTVCLADAQSKGRGRVNNVWESPAGCLMFSHTVQMQNGHILPLLQYVVSLALVEAIKELCQEQNLPILDLKIKWPNDIYLNGLKVGGISCNSTYKSGNFNISTGVGLNLDNRNPTTCLNFILQEQTSVPKLLHREEILASYFNKFEDFFNVFLNQGFSALEDLYYKAWLHSGQRVSILEKLEDQTVEETFVTIQGITSSGYLLAVDGENDAYELHPDGNSLDFFKGLIRRKLN